MFLNVFEIISKPTTHDAVYDAPECQKSSCSKRHTSIYAVLFPSSIFSKLGNSMYVWNCMYSASHNLRHCTTIRKIAPTILIFIQSISQTLLGHI